MALRIYTLNSGKSFRRISSWLLLLSTFALLLAACGGNSKKQDKEEVLVLEDDLGREVVIQGKPKRVFALASSMTEMLFAVLDSSSIIARTPQDNYPAGVYSKPIVQNYPIDYEQVLRLKPDLIFTVEGMTPLDAAARLEELGIPVYYQKYSKVADIFNGLEAIGKIMGREKQAKKLTDSLRNEVKILRGRYSIKTTPFKVLAITWSDPIYVYGQNTILTDKLQILGAENAVKEVFDQPYPALTREYILKLNPDVLLGGTKRELDEKFFNLYPELRKINAYQKSKMYSPTDDLMSRPSPRVVESLKELEGFLYK